MKSAPVWSQQGPDLVTIEQGGIGPARLLGLPFAAAGAYFLYQFADGVLHPSTMTIAGWLLLPLMTAAFLVPGWILLFGRKRTRIQITLREATEEFDFLVYARKTRTRIPADAHVLLRYEGSGTTYMITVNLVADAGKTILLGLLETKEKPAALDFAQKVSRQLGIDVQDRCIEGGEVAAGGVVVERLGAEDAD